MNMLDAASSRTRYILLKPKEPQYETCITILPKLFRLCPAGHSGIADVRVCPEQGRKDRGSALSVSEVRPVQRIGTRSGQRKGCLQEGFWPGEYGVGHSECAGHKIPFRLDYQTVHGYFDSPVS